MKIHLSAALSAVLALGLSPVLAENNPVANEHNTRINAPTPAAPAAITLQEGAAPVLLVEFPLGGSAIPETFTSNLKSVGDYLQKNSETKLTVTGYADNTGTHNRNVTLAQQRADAVRAYLMTNYGIVADRIEAKGQGAVTSKAANSTAASQQFNRRAYASVSRLSTVR